MVILEAQHCWDLVAEIASSMALCSLVVGVDPVGSPRGTLAACIHGVGIYKAPTVLLVPCLALGIH